MFLLYCLTFEGMFCGVEDIMTIILYLFLSIQPLFLYMAYQAPHKPAQVPDKYSKHYAHMTGKRKIFAGNILLSHWSWYFDSDCYRMRGMGDEWNLGYHSYIFWWKKCMYAKFKTWKYSVLIYDSLPVSLHLWARRRIRINQNILWLKEMVRNM